MSDFVLRDGRLYCEDVSLEDVAAQAGTPCYVYSARALVRAFDELDSAFSTVDRLICYSVKSNANLSVIRLLASRGAGADIVSGGELFRALKGGVPAEKIVYSGVGKSESEIRYALESGILAFNVESVPELETLDRIAGETGRVAQVCLRVNPDVESRTHKYTDTGKKESKFGIPIDAALDQYREIGRFRHLRVYGLDTHIGSQITSHEPFVLAFRKLAELYIRLREQGFPLEAVDIGGGLGITYRDERPPTPREYADAVLPILKPLGCRVILEPGRYISGNAGALLTRVIYFKQTGTRNFAIVDAGMNDLLRPSLYNAHHEILFTGVVDGRPVMKMDVVGPICESGDFLALDRELPRPDPGDLLAVLSAGAYGFVMSSNYNSRPRGAEVLVENGGFRVVRRAETLDDLIRGEET